MNNWRALSIAAYAIFLVSHQSAPAHASCNVIPAAYELPYRSTEGGIKERIGVPSATGQVGKPASGTVTIHANPCGSAVFERGKVKVTLEVTPATTMPPAPSPVTYSFKPNTDQIAYPGCEPPNNSCSIIALKLPVTTSPQHPRGLAGPTRIIVKNEGPTNSNTDDIPVADISRIYRPNTSCPLSGTVDDDTFKHFILLPPANDFTSATGPSPNRTIYGALDEEGRLLVPVDFETQVQGKPSTIGTLLAALDKTRRDRTSPPDQTIGMRIKDRDDPMEQILFFTPEGRALPPLARVYETGGLLGLADAPFSVIRIDPIVDPPGPVLFEKRDDVLYAAGPVEMAYNAEPAFDRAVPLISLRTSDQMIAFARDEAFERRNLDGNPDRDDFVLEVMNARQANPRATGTAVATHARANVFEPFLDVGGDTAAMLEPQYDATRSFIEGYRHRLFRNNGSEIIQSPVRRATNERRIADSAVTIYMTGGNPPEGTAFYSEPDGDHDVLAAVHLKGAGKVGTKRPPVKRAATAGGHAVLLSPEPFISGTGNDDGDDHDDIAQFYTLQTQQECLIDLKIDQSGTAVSAAGAEVAISEDIVVVSVPEYAQSQSALNDDGDTGDDVVYLWRVSDLLAQCNGGSAVNGLATNYAGEQISAWGDMALFLAPESKQNISSSSCRGGLGTYSPSGCDLNRDTDTDDRVLIAYGIDDVAHITHRAARDYQASAVDDGFIAFRVPEAGQREDLNADNDRNDDVLHVFFPSCGQKLYLQPVRNIGWSALPCDFAACDPRYPYRVQGNLIWFVTDQKQPGPIAVAAAKASGCGASFVGLLEILQELSNIAIENPPFPPFPLKILGEEVLMRTSAAAEGEEASGIAFSADLDDDGILDVFDNCTDFPNTDLLDVDGDKLGDKHCDAQPAACPKRPLPATECVVADDAGAKLCLDDQERLLLWNWGASPASHHLEEPADPIELTPHYSLCVYADDGRAGPIFAKAALPWDRCGEPPCWEGSAQRGFTLRGSESLAGNLRSLALPGSIAAGGRQTFLAADYLPASPDPGAASFGARNTVQLIMRIGDETRCWSSTHAAPLDAGQCVNPMLAGGAKSAP